MKSTTAITASLACVSLGLAAAPVFAGGTIKVDETKSFNIGAGLRTSFVTQDKQAPNSTDRGREFELDSIRIYMGGQITKLIKFTFNTERNSAGDVVVIDGIAQFEFNNAFNLWMGRFLPPSDRSNLSGPYYLTAWDFPIVQKYPAIVAGRDDGLAVWGQPGDGRFKYQVGFFQGRDGGSNQQDNLLLASRLSYSFWDIEKGYYNSSTYHGAMDVLSVGLVYMSQSDGAGTNVAGNRGDFTGYSADVLFEKKVGGGDAMTFEAAYYDYDLDNKTDSSLEQGDGYMLLGAYLVNNVGPGKLQPHVRLQKFKSSGATTGKTDRTDIGVNYILDGHNARLSLVYTDHDAPASSNDFDKITFGVQLQF